MRAKWPDLKPYLREETSPQACESLSRGNLDCVLLALPYACGDVDSSVLFQDRLFVAVPGNHAVGLGARIPAAAIEPDRLLMMEDGHCLMAHALSACNRPDIDRKSTRPHSSPPC